ncbi:MAG: uridylate kinase [Methylophilaceae bacterium]|nr:uridylate kinase [Methylophilaceae bacterium]
MWVIKLGGSLIGSSELTSWLDILARFSHGKVIIVPGGGIFADAVRQAQKLTQLNDQAAHKMAVLAMNQYGELIASLNPVIVKAASELEIAERGFQHRAIVWLPSQMVSADEAIPANWDVTSDSLAAWLAVKLNAEHLVLVKSADLSQYLKPNALYFNHLSCDGLSRPIGLQTLINNGLVDSSLKAFVTDQHFSTWVINKHAYKAFEEGIDTDKLSAAALLVNAID